jgi:hypothetical protein
MKLLLITLFCYALLCCGCAQKKAAPQADIQPDIANAELVATLAAMELSNSKKGRVIVTEVSTALDVFCGDQQGDALALVKLLKGKLGDAKNRRRVALLLLLLDRASIEINPSDHVQWAGVACRLRRGIKLGLDL